MHTMVKEAYKLRPTMHGIYAIFIVVLLVTYSASANDDNIPAIHKSVAKGDTVALLRMLKEDPSMRDLKFSFYGTPLHVASNMGKMAPVRMLVLHGANINSYTENGATPLMAAIDNGHTEIALFLVSKGADPNPKEMNSWGPIHAAVMEKDFETVQALVKNGARINERDLDGGIRGMTPLLCTGFNCCVDIAQFLIQHGAEIDAADYEDRWTTLHRASIAGCVDLVSLLLKKGAKKELRDRLGKTALGKAIEFEKQNVVRMLR